MQSSTKLDLVAAQHLLSPFTSPLFLYDYGLRGPALTMLILSDFEQ
jgi:hypothetical protein